MESLLRDLRHGLRLLGRNRTATAVSVLTLALGIGANSAIFSVVHAVLLRPLPVRDANRLAAIALVNQRLHATGAQPGYASYGRWKEYGTLFESIGAAAPGSAVAETASGMGAVKFWRVTASFLPTLGVECALGRNFTEQEDQPGAGRVAMLGYDFWRSRFDGDRRAIGATVRVDGAPYTVIGVLPRGFHVDGRPADVYAPVARSPRAPGNFPVNVYARLRPGVGLEPATAQMQAIAQSLDKGGMGWRPRLWKLRDFQVRDVELSLWVLMGAVGMVLLIACANTASLLLARAGARRKELAVRAALGAGRSRLLRQLLAESTVLALAGGACGIGLAACAIRLVPLIMNDRLPGLLEQSRMDGVALGFTLALSIVTGLAFGAAPAWSMTQSNPADRLRASGNAGERRGGYRACRALVVAETAVALLLAIGATLLIRSFFYLRDVAPGFRVEGLLAAAVNSDKGRFGSPDQVARRYQEIAAQVRAIPGVQAASFASALPLSGDNWVMSVPVEGHVYTNPKDMPMLYHRTVDAEYFKTLQIPLLRGRLFGPRDGQGAPLVAVVNDAFARRFWPGENPVGKHIGGGRQVWEVIGVSGDVRHQDTTQDAPVEVFFHHAQSPTARVTLAVRADPRVYRNPLLLEPALRRAVAMVDRGQPVTRVAEVRQTISDRVAPKRLSAQFTGAFAGLALLLAGIGVYGVLGFSVTRRTHEIGVRMALGAEPGQLVRMVTAEAAMLAAAGVAIGLAAAACLTRVVSSLLYGVATTEPWVFAGAAALVMGIAVAAALVPALRAARVDPLLALRHE